MAEAGRRGTKSRERNEHRPRIIIAALIVAIFSASSLSLMPNPPSEIPPAPAPAKIAYTSHGTIFIDGNSGFNNASGVVWGTGIISDPYIISGWDISAAGAIGIRIQNTSAYFEVKDCFVHDGGLTYFGIILWNCVNGALINNTCSNNFWGITLTISSNNTLSNNNCSSNNYHGIVLDFSDNNLLSGNNCSSNGWSGIYLYDSSSNNTLSNNNCSSNAFDGIILDYCGNNTIIWSQLFYNVRCGVRIYSGLGNAIWNNTFIGNNGSGSVYDANHIQACDNGTNNRWNSSGTPHGYGNYWYDWTTPDSVAPWGIVDGPYSICGNSSAEDHCPLFFPPERIAPVTTAVSTGTIGTNGWFRSNVSVSLSATDAGSGVNATYYRNGTSGSWLKYSNPLVLSSEGNSIVQFCSIDNSGNNETAKSIAVMIDTKSPTTNVTISVSTVTLVASDNVSGVNLTKYRVNSGLWLNYSGAFQVNATGNHTVEFYSIDKAGNNEIIRATWVDNGGSEDPGSIFRQYGIPILALTIVIIVIISVYHVLTRKDKEHE